MNWNDVADRIRIHRCMEMRRCDSCGCRNKKGLNPCQHAEAMACSCDKIADNLPAEHTPEEIVLNSDRLYVQFSQLSISATHGFMWRTVKGRKDYTGGPNQWASWQSVTDLPALALRMLAHVNRESA